MELMKKLRTYHGVHTSSVASLDQKSDICIHERYGHGDGRSVWKDKLGVVAETLDEAEDVIPATAVETSRMVAELVDDLSSQ